MDFAVEEEPEFHVEVITEGIPQGTFGAKGISRQNGQDDVDTGYFR